jgi:hypothetical protein
MGFVTKSGPQISLSPVPISGVNTGKKDVMKLTGMMAALGSFISELGGKGLPSSSY